MKYLKDMVPNNVLVVPKLEIAYANYSSTQQHLFKVQSTLGEQFFWDTSHKIFQCTKIRKDKSLTLNMKYCHGKKIKD